LAFNIQRLLLVEPNFFEAYPKDLVDIDLMTIYCDGKDYWK